MLHLVVGIGIALMFGLGVHPLFGLVLGIGAGAGKETFDLISGRGTPEWSDLLWTAAGAVAGAATAWGIS